MLTLFGIHFPTSTSLRTTCTGSLIPHPFSNPLVCVFRCMARVSNDLDGISTRRLNLSTHQQYYLKRNLISTFHLCQARSLPSSQEYTSCPFSRYTLRSWAYPSRSPDQCKTTSGSVAGRRTAEHDRHPPFFVYVRDSFGSRAGEVEMCGMVDIEYGER